MNERQNALRGCLALLTMIEISEDLEAQESLADELIDECGARDMLITMAGLALAYMEDEDSGAGPLDFLRELGASVDKLPDYEQKEEKG